MARSTWNFGGGGSGGNWQYGEAPDQPGNMNVGSIADLHPALQEIVAMLQSHPAFATGTQAADVQGAGGPTAPEPATSAEPSGTASPTASTAGVSGQPPASSASSELGSATGEAGSGEAGSFKRGGRIGAKSPSGGRGGMAILMRGQDRETGRPRDQRR